MYLSDIHAAEKLWIGNDILEMVLLSFMLVILLYLVLRLSKQPTVSGIASGTGQLLLGKRLKVYDSMARNLYQLLCFFSYSGIWTEISPPQVFLIKSELDRKIETYGPLFSEELREHYQNFVKMCFVSSSGWQHELKIKSNYVLRKDHFPGWEDQWIELFDNKNVVDAVVLRERYHQIIDAFWRSVE